MTPSVSPGESRESPVGSKLVAEPGVSEKSLAAIGQAVTVRLAEIACFGKVLSGDAN